MSDEKFSIKPIGEIFAKNLTIPDYQRPYRWDTQNVKELIDDILNAIKSNKDEYLLGNIILHKNGKKYDIIDGQQRFTTLALMLKFCNKELEFLNQTINPNSKNALIRNYAFIANKLGDKNKEDLAKFIIDKICVTCCIVDTIDEAFDIFDTQNTRGKELTDIDLLKNHHFSYISADEITQKQIALKFKEFQNKEFNENSKFSLLENALNDLYIARKIFNNENFTMGYYVDYKRSVLIEFKGIKDNGYTRELPLKFSSNIIKGNEFFSYLFMKTNLYEGIFEKSKISTKFYINQAMRIMLIFYVDRYGMDKNYEKFFEMALVHIFVVMSDYARIPYNALGVTDRLKHIFRLINSSDFSGYLIENMQDGMLKNDFGEVKLNNIKRAFDWLVNKYKKEEYITKISHGVITFKETQK